MSRYRSPQFDSIRGKLLTARRIKYYIRKGVYGPAKLKELKELERLERERKRRVREITGRAKPRASTSKPKTAEEWQKHLRNLLAK